MELVDPPPLSFAIPPALVELAQRTRAFVEEELAPLEQQFLLDGRVGWDERRVLESTARDRGLWALEAPTEVGGCGYGQVALALVAEELYKSPIMFGPLPGDMFGGSPEPALYLCNDEQRERYFYPILRGEKHSAYAFTEPGTGSDIAAIETVAVRDGDAFVLNGTKKFIGWVDFADFLMVFAKTDPAAGARGVSCFLVDKETPGFEIVRQLPTMGDQWAPFELSFTDCRVPAGNLLGKLNGGFVIASDQLTHGRLKIAALQLGLAARAIEIAVEHAKQRTTWGKPLASRQSIQWMLADSEVELQAARLLVHKAAWMADTGALIRTEAFVAKLYATEMAQRVTDRCMQIQGGLGYLRESPIQSLFRQARLWRIGHGTSEIHRWMIARDMLGLTSGIDEPMTVDHIGPRTLTSLLADRVAASPEHVALVFEDRARAISQYTYAELADAAARVAGGLAGLGIGVGDKVVLHLTNRPEFVITLLALARLGAVAVPSNTALTTTEIAHVAGWSDAVMAITTPDFADRFDVVRRGLPALRSLVIVGGATADRGSAFSELTASAPYAEPVAIDSEAPLEILFTSGTTSAPKGVVLTHANWLWSGERATHWLRIEPEDRLCSALPLFHVNAQTFTLMASLTVGATAIFLEQYSASRFIEQLRHHRATCVSLVAVVVRTLLAQPASAADRDHHLRRVNYAINVSTPEKDAFEQRFGVELLNGYGLSEAMTEVTVCPVFGPRRWPSIGQPAFGREVRLVDASGAEVPTGEVGEITVRGVAGRTIMQEYYKDPEATARTIVDGWLHTGDNGYFDEAGYLYFFDRGKDVIKRAGENVSASEVELTLAAHPAVALAAVIGVPDPFRDEAVAAVIVTREGMALTEEEIVTHCAERLAPFKVPTVIEFRDELPLTSIGKVEKRQLRALVSEPRPV